MKQLFPNLMQPIKIRNTVFRNRLMATTSIPHFIQGPEAHPNDHMIRHLAQRAKSGAGIVTISHTYTSKGPISFPGMAGDPPHFPEYDIWEPKNQNYMIMLNDAIHYYGSKSCLDLAFHYDFDYDVSPDPEHGIKELTREMIDEYIDLFLEQCELVPALGFDMVSIHCAYGDTFMARFLSPATNHRTDEYGGSLENRAKIPLEVFRRIKEKMGQNFITSAAISAEETVPGGYDFEEFCKFAKMADGLIDIMQVRMGDIDEAHPTGYCRKNPTLPYAQRLKQIGLKQTVIAPVGGFQDPFVIEEALASGKADMIAGSRMWIADAHYAEKLAEGHPEDITPCILCNRCHVISNNYPYLSMCSVNPEFGIQHVLDKAVSPVKRKKFVAVVGGGPGGMRAACILADRGHNVTLYEKTDHLGGALIPAGQPEFKWPIRRYLDWQILQLKKRNIKILMNTAATPELIRDMGYDAVIAAVGGEPALPPISGIDRDHVITAIQALNEPDLVKGKVVVIGGGGIGTETALHLARNGHATTILEMLPQLAEEDMVPHVGTIILSNVETTEGLDYKTEVKVTGIETGFVQFIDQDGAHHQVSADTVVIATGTKPLQDEGMGYYGIVPESFVIGDCSRVGTLMLANRAAFAAANNI